MEEPGNPVVGGQWEPGEESRAAITGNLRTAWGPAKQDTSKTKWLNSRIFLFHL